MRKISPAALNVATVSAKEDFRRSVRTAYESICTLFKFHDMPHINACTDTSLAVHSDKYYPYESVCMVVRTPLQLLRLSAACSVANVKKISLVLQEESNVMLYIAQYVGASDIYPPATSDEVVRMIENEKIEKLVSPAGFLSLAQEENLYKKGVDVNILEHEYLTVIVADNTFAEQWIAADILHILGGEDRHDVCLVSTDEKYITHVMTAMDGLKKYLPDGWGDSMMTLRTFYCPTEEQLVRQCEELRPMRLILSCAQAEHYADEIRNVGSVFISKGEPHAVHDMTGSVEPAPCVHHSPLTSISGGDFMRRTHFHVCGEDNVKNPDIWYSMLTMAENAGCMKAEALALCMRLISTTSKK